MEIHEMYVNATHLVRKKAKEDCRNVMGSKSDKPLKLLAGIDVYDS